MMALTPEQIHYLNQYAPGEAVSHALSELLFIDHDLLGIDATNGRLPFALRCTSSYLSPVGM